MRQFTKTEWRDLARGQRMLAGKDEEGIVRNAGTSVVGQFERSKRHHLEMAAACEEWAKRAPPD